jgi:hypothetical protein
MVEMKEQLCGAETNGRRGRRKRDTGFLAVPISDSGLRGLLPPVILVCMCVRAYLGLGSATNLPLLSRLSSCFIIRPNVALIQNS